MYLPDASFQNQAFLLSVGFGTLLGLLYDFFRIVRIAANDRKHAVFVQDVLFLAVSAFLTVLFLLVVNNGSLRLYIIFAMAVGFFAYYFTLSRIVIQAGQILLDLFRKLILLLSRLICVPIRPLVRFFAYIHKNVTKKRENNKKKS